MEIIIGRDPDSNCLALMIDGKRAIDSTLILPNSVSRLKPEKKTGHCRLSIKGESMRISNLNPQNITYVDGEEIDNSKKIDAHSIVELGADQYRVSIKRLLKKIGYVPPVSIKHLKRVWERYDHALLKLQIDQQKTANQQKLQGLISQASVLCALFSSFIPIPIVIRVVLVMIALGLGLYFYLKGRNTDDSFVIKKRELDERFNDDYVCPKCGYFFGYTPYESLTYKKNCPNPNCNVPLTT